MELNFYRPATQEDFKNHRVELNNNQYMDDETKQLIEQGDLTIAMNRVRKQTGRGMFDCKNDCLKYQRFVYAKNDFEQGKPVFVPY